MQLRAKIRTRIPISGPPFSQFVGCDGVVLIEDCDEALEMLLKLRKEGLQMFARDGRVELERATRWAVK